MVDDGHLSYYHLGKKKRNKFAVSSQEGPNYGQRQNWSVNLDWNMVKARISFDSFDLLLCRTFRAII